MKITEYGFNVGIKAYLKEIRYAKGECGIQLEKFIPEKVEMDYWKPVK